MNNTSSITQRDFTIADIKGFIDNGYGSPTDVIHLYQDDTYIHRTFEDVCGDVLGIVTFKLYNKRNNEWQGHFHFTKNMSKKHARSVLEIFNELIHEFRPASLWTISRCDATIRRWHKFLGFHRTGAITYEDKQFEIWEMVWV